MSLRSKSIAITTDELNAVAIIVGDVFSICIEAFTNERVYFIAGSEFGPLKGCLLPIVRALYGLRTSGADWQHRYSDVMRIMGFHPC